MFEWVTEFPKRIYLDVKKPIDQAIEYMMDNWGAFFDGISMFLRQILLWVQTVINASPGGSIWPY